MRAQFGSIYSLAYVNEFKDSNSTYHDLSAYEGGVFKTIISNISIVGSSFQLIKAANNGGIIFNEYFRSNLTNLRI